MGPTNPSRPDRRFHGPQQTLPFCSFAVRWRAAEEKKEELGGWRFSIHRSAGVWGRVLRASVVIVDVLEDELILVLDFELFEKLNVFIAERPDRVMFYLVLDKSYDSGNLRMAVGKCPKPFLPCEMARNPSFAIDEVRRAVFDVAHEVRKGQFGLEADKQVRVVRHAMNRQKLLRTLCDDTADLFMKFFFEFRADQVLPSLDGKNNLDINLGVGIRHCGKVAD